MRWVGVAMPTACVFLFLFVIHVYERNYKKKPIRQESNKMCCTYEYMGNDEQCPDTQSFLRHRQTQDFAFS